MWHDTILGKSESIDNAVYVLEGYFLKKLQKEFEAFDKEIRIDNETSALIEKRNKLKNDIEDHFPEECEKYNISVTKSDLRFILQGSYKIGTTISNDDKGVDLDYAVIMPLDVKKHNDPRQVKKAAQSALEIKNVRIPQIKEPCVTVAYHTNGVETMHIDFPIYAENNGQLYLARGKATSETYKWEIADPEGLNDYLIEQFKNRPQLKRIVRYIKKWKQEKYNNSTNSHEVPPSIGLTLLACQKYAEYTYDGADDLRSLYYTLNAIYDSFIIQKDAQGTILSANIVCNLPVEPYSDVFYKMRDNSKHMITFYNRISSAVNNLKEAVNISDAHEAAKYVQKVLGNDFNIPEKQSAAADTSNKREYSFG